MRWKKGNIIGIVFVTILGLASIGGVIWFVSEMRVELGTLEEEFPFPDLYETTHLRITLDCELASLNITYTPLEGNMVQLTHIVKGPRRYGDTYLATADFWEIRDKDDGNFTLSLSQRPKGTAFNRYPFSYESVLLVDPKVIIELDIDTNNGDVYIHAREPDTTIIFRSVSTDKGDINLEFGYNTTIEGIFVIEAEGTISILALNNTIFDYIYHKVEAEKGAIFLHYEEIDIRTSLKMLYETHGGDIFLNWKQNSTFTNHTIQLETNTGNIELNLSFALEIGTDFRIRSVKIIDEPPETINASENFGTYTFKLRTNSGDITIVREPYIDWPE